jgi:Amt family ammonium transporter
MAFRHRRLLTPALLALALVVPAIALAEEPTVTPGEFFANNLWMMLCSGLVFIMHLGFATLESGLTRSKNTTNILFKNTFIVSIGILTYALIGFNLMYPGDFNGYLGFAGVGIGSGPEGMTVAYASGGYTYWTDFLFQAMFAATAATIVSGAVAERIKLPSSLVHSVGGWGALAGALLLGPRLGKYVAGRINPIPGHSMPLATIGVFLLWLGWFGFNGGSVLSASPESTSFTLVTTCLAAAAGCIGAIIASWVQTTKPDLSMALNGILAGLVGITAGADTVSIAGSVVIGLVAGGIVVFSVLFFDRIKVDDPVGAVSVHLVCGIWGTLAVGLFSTNPEHSFLVQLFGVAVYAAFTFPFALALFAVIKATMGLRVSPDEEMEGLDFGEHGMHAYDFGGTSGSGVETAMGHPRTGGATTSIPIEA